MSVNKINYKEPSQEQLKIMQDFADVCSKGIEIIVKCNTNLALQNSSSRLQEAMQWFHSYIVNGGSLKEEEKAEKDEPTSTIISSVVN